MTPSKRGTQAERKREVRDGLSLTKVGENREERPTRKTTIGRRLIESRRAKPARREFHQHAPGGGKTG